MTSLVSGLQRIRNHNFLLCPLGKMNAKMYIKSVIWTSESLKMQAYEEDKAYSDQTL